MPRIASTLDILSKLTEIMERDDPDNKNLSSTCRAAELLGKYYGLFEGGGAEAREDDRAIIIDDCMGQGE